MSTKPLTEGKAVKGGRNTVFQIAERPPAPSLVQQHAASCWPKWRPIETAPRDETDVLLLCKNGALYSDCFDPLSKRFVDGDPSNPYTHWMPLPQPPRKP